MSDPERMWGQLFIIFLILLILSLAGTTLKVAIQHRRNGIGIELNPDYIELAHERINNTQIQLAI